MKAILLAAAALTLTAPELGVGQPNVVLTSEGVVEFIGLKRWTPEKIQSALGYESADRLHYCASELTKLGFADASVLVGRIGSRRHTAITVIEPEDAHVVAFRPEPKMDSAVPETWSELRQIAHRPDYLSGGFLAYGASELTGRRVATPEQWWTVLAQRRTGQDYKAAVRALQEDGDPVNRAVSAMILVHFADQQETWLALMEGIRDANFVVRSTAQQSLVILAQHAPRPGGLGNCERQHSGHPPRHELERAPGRTGDPS